MGLAAMALTILFYLIEPSAKILAWVAGIVILSLIVLLFVAISALKDALETARVELPKVLTVINGDDDEVTLLLGPSELFGIATMVSVYNVDSQTGFELLLGYGRVSTVQADGKIQIIVDDWQLKDDSYRDGLSRGNIEAISSTIVRPSAPHYRRGRFTDRASDPEDDRPSRLSDRQIMQILNRLEGSQVSSDE